MSSSSPMNSSKLVNTWLFVQNSVDGKWFKLVSRADVCSLIGDRVKRFIESVTSIPTHQQILLTLDGEEIHDNAPLRNYKIASSDRVVMVVRENNDYNNSNNADSQQQHLPGSPALTADSASRYASFSNAVPLKFDVAPTIAPPPPQSTNNSNKNNNTLTPATKSAAPTVNNSTNNSINPPPSAGTMTRIESLMFTPTPPASAPENTDNATANKNRRGTTSFIDQNETNHQKNTIPITEYESNSSNDQQNKQQQQVEKKDHRETKNKNNNNNNNETKLPHPQFPPNLVYFTPEETLREKEREIAQRDLHVPGSRPGSGVKQKNYNGGQNRLAIARATLPNDLQIDLAPPKDPFFSATDRPVRLHPEDVNFQSRTIVVRCQSDDNGRTGEFRFKADKNDADAFKKLQEKMLSCLKIAPSPAILNQVVVHREDEMVVAKNVIAQQQQEQQEQNQKYENESGDEAIIVLQTKTFPLVNDHQLKNTIIFVPDDFPFKIHISTSQCARSTPKERKFICRGRYIGILNTFEIPFSFFPTDETDRQGVFTRFKTESLRAIQVPDILVNNGGLTCEVFIDRSWVRLASDAHFINVITLALDNGAQDVLARFQTKSARGTKVISKFKCYVDSTWATGSLKEKVIDIPVASLIDNVNCKNINDALNETLVDNDEREQRRKKHPVKTSRVLTELEIEMERAKQEQRERDEAEMKNNKLSTKSLLAKLQALEKEQENHDGNAHIRALNSRANANAVDIELLSAIIRAKTGIAPIHSVMLYRLHEVPNNASPSAPPMLSKIKRELVSNEEQLRQAMAAALWNDDGCCHLFAEFQPVDHRVVTVPIHVTLDDTDFPYLLGADPTDVSGKKREKFSVGVIQGEDRDRSFEFSTCLTDARALRRLATEICIAYGKHISLADNFILLATNNDVGVEPQILNQNAQFLDAISSCTLDCLIVRVKYLNKGEDKNKNGENNNNNNNSEDAKQNVLLLLTNAAGMEGSWRSSMVPKIQENNNGHHAAARRASLIHYDESIFGTTQMITTIEQDEKDCNDNNKISEKNSNQGSLEQNLFLTVQSNKDYYNRALVTFASENATNNNENNDNGDNKSNEKTNPNKLPTSALSRISALETLCAEWFELLDERGLDRIDVEELRSIIMTGPWISPETALETSRALDGDVKRIKTIKEKSSNNNNATEGENNNNANSRKVSRNGKRPVTNETNKSSTSFLGDVEADADQKRKQLKSGGTEKSGISDFTLNSEEEKPQNKNNNNNNNNIRTQDEKPSAQVDDVDEDENQKPQEADVEAAENDHETDDTHHQQQQRREPIVQHLIDFIMECNNSQDHPTTASIPASDLFDYLFTWTAEMNGVHFEQFIHHCRVTLDFFSNCSTTSKSQRTVVRAFRAIAVNGRVNRAFLQRCISESQVVDDFTGFKILNCFSEDLSEEDFFDVVTFLLDKDYVKINQLASAASLHRPHDSSVVDAVKHEKHSSISVLTQLRHVLDDIPADVFVAFFGSFRPSSDEQRTALSDLAFAVLSLLRVHSITTIGDRNLAWLYIKHQCSTLKKAHRFVSVLRGFSCSFALQQTIAEVASIVCTPNLVPSKLLYEVSVVACALSKWCSLVAEYSSCRNGWTWPPPMPRPGLESAHNNNNNNNISSSENVTDIYGGKSRKHASGNNKNNQKTPRKPDVATMTPTSVRKQWQAELDRELLREDLPMITSPPSSSNLKANREITSKNNSGIGGSVTSGIDLMMSATKNTNAAEMTDLQRALAEQAQLKKLVQDREEHKKRKEEMKNKTHPVIENSIKDFFSSPADAAAVDRKQPQQQQKSTILHFESSDEENDQGNDRRGHGESQRRLLPQKPRALYAISPAQIVFEEATSQKMVNASATITLLDHETKQPLLDLNPLFRIGQKVWKIPDQVSPLVVDQEDEEFIANCHVVCRVEVTISPSLNFVTESKPMKVHDMIHATNVLSVPMCDISSSSQNITTGFVNFEISQLVPRQQRTPGVLPEDAFISMFLEQTAIDPEFILLPNCQQQILNSPTQSLLTNEKERQQQQRKETSKFVFRHSNGFDLAASLISAVNPTHYLLVHEENHQHDQASFEEDQEEQISDNVRANRIIRENTILVSADGAQDLQILLFAEKLVEKQQQSSSPSPLPPVSPRRKSLASSTLGPSHTASLTSKNTTTTLVTSRGNNDNNNQQRQTQNTFSLVSATARLLALNSTFTVNDEMIAKKFAILPMFDPDEVRGNPSVDNNNKNKNNDNIKSPSSCFPIEAATNLQRFQKLSQEKKIVAMSNVSIAYYERIPLLAQSWMMVSLIRVSSLFSDDPLGVVCNPAITVLDRFQREMLTSNPGETNSAEFGSTGHENNTNPPSFAIPLPLQRNHESISFSVVDTTTSKENSSNQKNNNNNNHDGPPTFMGRSELNINDQNRFGSILEEASEAMRLPLEDRRRINSGNEPRDMISANRHHLGQLEILIKHLHTFKSEQDFVDNYINYKPKDVRKKKSPLVFICSIESVTNVEISPEQQAKLSKNTNKTSSASPQKMNSKTANHQDDDTFETFLQRENGSHRQSSSSASFLNPEDMYFVEVAIKTSQQFIFRTRSKIADNIEYQHENEQVKIDENTNAKYNNASEKTSAFISLDFERMFHAFELPQRNSAKDDEDDFIDDVEDDGQTENSAHMNSSKNDFFMSEIQLSLYSLPNRTLHATTSIDLSKLRSFPDSITIPFTNFPSNNNDGNTNVTTPEATSPSSPPTNALQIENNNTGFVTILLGAGTMSETAELTARNRLARTTEQTRQKAANRLVVESNAVSRAYASCGNNAKSLEERIAALEKYRILFIDENFVPNVHTNMPRNIGALKQNFADLYKEVNEAYDPSDPNCPAATYFNQNYIPWMRPRMFLAEAELPVTTATHIAAKDTHRGAFGDVGLQNALRHLADRSGMVKSALRQGALARPELGLYILRLCNSLGLWTTVILDDLFPVQITKYFHDVRLLGSRSSIRREFWSAFLQKALAKMRGGYDQLKQIDTIEALQSITGLPVRRSDFLQLQTQTDEAAARRKILLLKQKQQQQAENKTSTATAPAAPLSPSNYTSKKRDKPLDANLVWDTIVSAAPRRDLVVLIPNKNLSVEKRHEALLRGIDITHSFTVLDVAQGDLDADIDARRREKHLDEQFAAIQQDVLTDKRHQSANDVMSASFTSGGGGNLNYSGSLNVVSPKRKSKVRLVKVRNPSRTLQWGGAWGPKSKLWLENANITEACRENLFSSAAIAMFQETENENIDEGHGKHNNSHHHHHHNHHQNKHDIDNTSASSSSRAADYYWLPIEVVAEYFSEVCQLQAQFNKYEARISGEFKNGIPSLVIGLKAAFAMGIKCSLIVENVDPSASAINNASSSFFKSQNNNNKSENNSFKADFVNSSSNLGALLSLAVPHDETLETDTGNRFTGEEFLYKHLQQQKENNNKNIQNQQQSQVDDDDEDEEGKPKPTSYVITHNSDNEFSRLDSRYVLKENFVPFGKWTGFTHSIAPKQAPYLLIPRLGSLPTVEGQSSQNSDNNNNNTNTINNTTLAGKILQTNCKFTILITSDSPLVAKGVQVNFYPAPSNNSFPFTMKTSQNNNGNNNVASPAPNQQQQHPHTSAVVRHFTLTETDEETMHKRKVATFYQLFGSSSQELKEAIGKKLGHICNNKNDKSNNDTDVDDDDLLTSSLEDEMRSAANDTIQQEQVALLKACKHSKIDPYGLLAHGFDGDGILSRFFNSKNENADEEDDDDFNLDDEKETTQQQHQQNNHSGSFNNNNNNNDFGESNANASGLQTQSILRRRTLEKVLLMCLSKNLPFIDIDFPASERRFVLDDDDDDNDKDNENENDDADDVPREELRPVIERCRAWMRPSMFEDELAHHVLITSINPIDQAPSDLDDIPVQSAVALLAERESSIRALFSGHRLGGLARIAAERALGAYRVCLYREGWWHDVVVDDYLPVALQRTRVESVVTRNKNPNQQWLAVLHKALAKLAGSYAHLPLADVEITLQVLTGSPSLNLTPRIVAAQQQQQEQNSNTARALLWACLETYHNNYHCYLNLSRDPEREEEYQQNGLDFGASYALLDCKEMTLGVRHTVKLLKFRDPFVSTIWNGEWCPGHENWRKYPNAAKECGVSEEDDRRKLKILLGGAMPYNRAASSAMFARSSAHHPHAPLTSVGNVSLRPSQSMYYARTKPIANNNNNNSTTTPHGTNANLVPVTVSGGNTPEARGLLPLGRAATATNLSNAVKQAGSEFDLDATNGSGTITPAITNNNNTNNVSGEIPQAIFRSDGIFWMSYEDALKQFVGGAVLFKPPSFWSDYRIRGKFIPAFSFYNNNDDEDDENDKSNTFMINNNHNKSNSNSNSNSLDQQQQNHLASQSVVLPAPSSRSMGAKPDAIGKDGGTTMKFIDTDRGVMASSTAVLMDHSPPSSPLMGKNNNNNRVVVADTRTTTATTNFESKPVQIKIGKKKFVSNLAVVLKVKKRTRVHCVLTQVPDDETGEFNIHPVCLCIAKAPSSDKPFELVQVSNAEFDRPTRKITFRLEETVGLVTTFDENAEYCVFPVVDHFSVNYHTSQKKQQSNSNAPDIICSTSFTIGLQMANAVDFEDTYDFDSKSIRSASTSTTLPTTKSHNGNKHDDSQKAKKPSTGKETISARFVKVPHDFDVVEMAKNQEEFEKQHKEMEDQKQYAKRLQHKEAEDKMMEKFRRENQSTSIATPKKNLQQEQANSQNQSASVNNNNSNGNDDDEGGVSTTNAHVIKNRNVAGNVPLPVKFAGKSAASLGLSGFRWPREASAVSTSYQYRPGLFAAGGDGDATSHHDDNSNNNNTDGQKSGGSNYLREVVSEFVIAE